MTAALSLTNIYLGFSTGNKVHQYYFGVWTLSGLRMWFVCTKQTRWMTKSKVVPDYKLEHTNKESDGRLTSLLLLARFFSSALVASWPCAPSKRSRPLLRLHYYSFHLMFSLWLTSILPCLTCIHDIPAKQSLGCPPPCLYLACGLIKDVGGASRDVSWCMYG
jgi:hypothetical protein